jgi:hypothetical protein
MLLTTPASIDAMTQEIDTRLAIHTPEDVTDERPEIADQSGKAEPQSGKLADESGKTEPQPLSDEDKAERLWWDKVEVLGKIKACSREIKEAEAEITDLQGQIKSAKEVQKGQQALLAKYSSQLADILDGHPLPKNPSTPDTSEEAPGASDAAPGASGDWRDTPTEKLLAGVKGLGAKKLEAIIELAPTAGKLEALRGEASMGHRLFKDVLPKGCGETLADEIENRLLECVKFAPVTDEEETSSAE